jgi:hypothetical protein
MPQACRHSSISSELSGVTLEGFRITEFPAASAGIASPMLLTRG